MTLRGYVVGPDEGVEGHDIAVKASAASTGGAITMMVSPTTGVQERRARLARGHQLLRPATRPEAAAEAVVGLHASDPVSVFLSAWARVKGFRVEDLEDALYERRSLVRMLGMRRTMFVVPV